jgi:hypothetical protein
LALNELTVADPLSALVTGDFFARAENLQRVKAAGCFSLFTGVESFDSQTLRRQNKRHSEVVPQVAMIRSCLEAGILLQYGIMLDPTTRRISDMEAEIDFILDSSAITLPAYLTLAIPLLGTPYFRQCLDERLILPS